MSKYFDKKFISDIGYKIIKPSLDDEFKNFIFSNISSGNYNILFDKITSDVYLNFTDTDNNSVIHSLLMVDNKLISEDTKKILIEFFIKRGAPINTYNKLKLTPLHIAINMGNNQIVDLLLKKGANPNAESMNKLTPLQLALRIKTNICTDLIIPKSIGEIEIKDKNELQNCINELIKNSFNKEYFNKIKIIYDNYSNLINIKDSEQDKIKKEIISITTKSNYNEEEIRIQINRKFEEYILNISKYYNKIDDKTVSIHLVKDKNEFCKLYIQDKIDEIKILEDSIKIKYNENLSFITNFKKEFNSFVNAKLHFIMTLIYINSINISLKNKSNFRIIFPKDSKVYILSGQRDDNSVITNFNKDRIGGVNYNIKIFNLKIPLQISDFIKNLLSFPDYLNENIQNIIKLLNEYLQLFNLNNMIKTIDLNTFVIDGHRKPISYKFLFLNYLKICKLLEIINSIIDLPQILTFDLNLIKYDDKILKIKLKTAVNLPDLTLNQQGYDDVKNHIKNYLDFISNADKKDIKIKKLQDLLVSQLQIDFNNINIQKGKCGESENKEIIESFNKITQNKYFLKHFKENYVTIFNSLPLLNIDTIKAQLENYFNNSIDLSKQIKYYHTPIIPLTPLPPIIYTNPNIINAIEDNDQIISNYNNDNNPDEVGNSFKLFTDAELTLIGNNLQKSKDEIKILYPDNSKNYICRDPTNDINIETNILINFLRNFIIKEQFEKIINVTGTSTNLDINNLLTKYNIGKVNEKFLLEETIKSNTNDLITQLLSYYNINYSNKELQKLFGSEKFKDYENKQYFIKDELLNIDITKLTDIDYKLNKDIFIDESSIIPPITKYYNFNYYSNDEASLCYKNNDEIIDKLLKNSSVNYLVRDADGNNILHDLSNIQNYNLFENIYNKSKDKFDKLKQLKNKKNQTPSELIDEQIKYNNNNFYKSPVSKHELLFSEIYSSELYIKLKNNNELNSLIPENIRNIYNDIYIIFNLKDINKDIFNTFNKKDYSRLFEYDKTSMWTLSAFNNINNIQKNLYDELQKRHDFRNKYMNSNTMINRFYNTIVHTLTLHFTSVYYKVLRKFLLELNGNKFGITEAVLSNFEKEIFDFDATYNKKNLAQNILISLYKINYDNKQTPNKLLTSLKDILRDKINQLESIIIENQKEEFEESMDKIYNYMQIYFESFNKKIIIFLNNYIKFIELQYNLQQIKQKLN
jgi:ankyrin repeat protein